jgi:hypothetical protein
MGALSPPDALQEPDAVWTFDRLLATLDQQLRSESDQREKEEEGGKVAAR